MNPIGSNICVAIAATMYCVEEETKIKIYNTFFSVCGCYATARLSTRLYSKEHTVLVYQLVYFQSNSISTVEKKSTCAFRSGRVECDSFIIKVNHSS